MARLIFGRDIASKMGLFLRQKNVAPEGMLVQGGGIELPYKYYLPASNKFKQKYDRNNDGTIEL